RAPRQRLHDIAPGVNDGTDSRRSRAQHRQSLLGGAQLCLGEVLRWPPAPEPGVVRGIEDEPWAMLLVHNIAGKDHLVAELQPDLAPFPADIDRPGAGSGCEVED